MAALLFATCGVTAASASPRAAEAPTVALTQVQGASPAKAENAATLPAVGSRPEGFAKNLTQNGGHDASQSFNTAWRFVLANPNDPSDPTGRYVKAAEPSYNDAAWQALTLPQDWSVEQTPTNAPNAETSGGTGYLQGGLGWYRKSFTLPASKYQGKQITMEFDGVLGSTATIYLNGKQVAVHHYGAVGFQVDLTEDAYTDGRTNVMAVRVEAKPDTHFYKGAGIYGNVWLLATESTHIPRHGVFVTTPTVAKTYPTQKFADVSIATDIVNSGAGTQIRNTVKDASGNVVASGVTTATAASGTSTHQSSLRVNDAKLWSTDTPNMYLLHTELVRDGKVIDAYTVPFGIRWVDFSADKGFFLNGEAMKLHGTNIHSTQTITGAVMNYDSAYRQLLLQKQAGVNAIRTAHNPPQPAFLAAAQDLGLLVENELSDGWAAKNTNYAPFFDTDSNTDIQEMVTSSRNSPSVFTYSLGNESAEATTTAAVPIVQRLTKAIQDVDNTRLVTWEPDLRTSVPGSAPAENLKLLPAFSVHYLSATMWDTYRDRYPTSITWEGEATNGHQTRGVYFQAHPNAIGYNQTPGKLVYSSYDTGQEFVFTGTEYALKVDRDREWLSGTFTWTGQDYLGEAAAGGVFPSKSAASGFYDTAGFAKDQKFLFQSQWSKDPMVHLLPMNWTDWKQGENVTVWANSNQPNVDLYLNDKLLSRKSFTQKTTPNGTPYLETDIPRGDDIGNVAPVNTSLALPAAAGDKVIYLADTTGYVGKKMDVTVGAEKVVVPYSVASIPAATTVAKAVSANKGVTNVKVNNTEGFHVGQQFIVGQDPAKPESGEVRTVTAVGSGASAPSSLVLPAASGDTKIYLDSTTNLKAGDRISIDSGDDAENSAIIAQVGNPAVKATTVVADSGAGATNFKVADIAGFSYGDKVQVGTGDQAVIATVGKIGTVGATGTGITLSAPIAGNITSGTAIRDLGSGVVVSAPLQQDHAATAAVSNNGGSGITFTGALKNAYAAGGSIRALGAGLTVPGGLKTAHAAGSPVTSPAGACVGSYADTNGGCGSLHLEWDVPFAPGTLVAKATDKNGKVTATDVVRTAGTADRTKTMPERQVIQADGSSLSYIEIDVNDKSGINVPTANNQLTVTVSGAGKLVGIDNGQNESAENYRAASHAAFQGKAIAIVQSTGAAGPIYVTTTSPGLLPSTTTVFASNATSGEVGSEGVLVRAKVGTYPALPAKVVTVTADGHRTTRTVTWKTLPGKSRKTPGRYELTGRIQGSTQTAHAAVWVYDEANVQSYSSVVATGSAPYLPAETSVYYTDGVSRVRPVKWAAVKPKQYAGIGQFTVTGVVSGVALRSTVSVRVTDQVTRDQNLALATSPTKPKADASFSNDGGPGGRFAPKPASSGLPSLFIDGDNTNAGWSNYWSRGATVTTPFYDAARDKDWVSLAWPAPQHISSLTSFFTVDEHHALPKTVQVSYWNGATWIPVTNQKVTLATGDNEPSTITFDGVSSTKIKVDMTSSAPNTSQGGLGIDELQAYGDLVAVNDTASLNSVKVNGLKVQVGSGTSKVAAARVLGADTVRIAAQAGGNGSITSIKPLVDGKPMSVPGTALITVTAEDGVTTKQYTLKLVR